VERPPRPAVSAVVPVQEQLEQLEQLGQLERLEQSVVPEEIPDQHQPRKLKRQAAEVSNMVLSIQI
jgi:hypothetical protein